MKLPFLKERIHRPSSFRLGAMLLTAAVLSLVTCARNQVESVMETPGPTPAAAPNPGSDTGDDDKDIDVTALIATWNIAWLNDEHEKGVWPRSEPDYRAIARTIEDTRAAIIFIQEVENETALGHVMQYLPAGFRSVTANVGAQDPAIIWNSERADVSNARLLEELNSDEYDVETTPEDFAFARLPLAADFVIGNFDGTCCVVHIRYPRSRDARDRQVEEIHRIQEWMRRRLQTEGVDPDILVGGDWNIHWNRWDNSPWGLTLFPGNTLEGASGPTTVSGSDSFDYFLVSTDAGEEVVPGSVEVLMFPDVDDLFEDGDEPYLSDHRPSRLTVDVSGETADR